jgi:hypothetical protein
MAHEGLWEQLVGLDETETARRAKCRYVTNPERYIITLLNTDYVVSLLDRQIFAVQPESEPRSAEFLEQLCILTYLINAKDAPLANKLVRAETLRGGQFFFRGLHGLPTDKLQEAFGQCPERLFDVAEQFDAERRDFADASIQLYVLPRIPLTMVVWRGDEEFAARASVLFDQSAADQLPLDALLAAVNLAVDALAEAAQSSAGG